MEQTMETNSKKVLAALPTFEDYMHLAEEIKMLYLEKMKLENELKRSEALNFQAVMTDPKYFKQGKPVPVSYYENAYKFTGLEIDLMQYRTRLAELVAELDNKRNQSEIYKIMHDLYKTLAYQEKAMS
jgi:hypothetical protein